MSVSGGGAVRANAVITVDKYQPVAYEKPIQGPVLTRIHVEERFSGDIQGAYAAMQAVVRSMTAIARPIVNMSSDVAVDGFAGQDHMSQPFATGSVGSLRLLDTRRRERLDNVLLRQWVGEGR